MLRFMGSHLKIIQGFPGGSEGEEFACNAETWVQFLGWEDPLEKGMATQSSILAWRLPWTQEMYIQFLGWEDPLEKEMATHSSILAWRTPWAEELTWPQGFAKSQTRLSNFHFHCTPMDCSPPGYSVHGVLQARILEWVVTSFSRGSFPPRD